MFPIRKQLFVEECPRSSDCCSSSGEEDSVSGTLSATSEYDSVYEEELLRKRKEVDEELDMFDCDADDDEDLTSCDDCSYSPKKPRKQFFEDESEEQYENLSRVFANQALVRFLKKYNLPLQAAEDPLFYNLIKAVQHSEEPVKLRLPQKLQSISLRE
jgi:hypothetical protein